MSPRRPAGCVPHARSSSRIARFLSSSTWTAGALLITLVGSPIVAGGAGGESDVAAGAGTEVGVEVEVEAEAEAEIVSADGLVGPVTALSGIWDDKLQNCMSVRTSLEASAWAAADRDERAQLARLHQKLVTQWEHQKEVVADGCDAAFADLPILSQCRFRVPFQAVQTAHLDGPGRALIEKYRHRGAVAFHYRYYNPETAIDDPLFEERCKAIAGEWEAVEKSSVDYTKAVELYEQASGSTRPSLESPSIEKLIR